MKIYTVHQLYPNSTDMLLATENLDMAIKEKDHIIRVLKLNHLTACLSVQIWVWENGKSKVLIDEPLRGVK